MKRMKHVLGFSGGVDSQACAYHMRVNLKIPAEDIIMLNSQAGRNEHPLTVEHVRWYSENVHPVIEVVPLIRDMGTRGTRPDQVDDDGEVIKVNETKRRREEFDQDAEMTFRDLAYIKQRFPSRKAQFCTEHLKLAPQLRWCKENLDDKGISYERYVGVRCDESAGRKDTPESKYDDYFRCMAHYPIRCWTKLECFAVLKHAGEKINPLYTMGFSRVGCAPCINSGKDDVREWAARFPEMIDKVRAWEESVGLTFFAPCVPGMEINWVDDVVAWSRTARGGRQPLLAFVENEAADGVCSSKYGLCE